MNGISSKRISHYTRLSLGVLPGLIAVIGLLVIPLGTLLRYSFNKYTPTELMIEAFTLENYARIIVDPFYRKVLGMTLSMSIGTALVSICLGYPVAYFLARTRTRFKSIIIILILFPLLVGNVVRAAGWMSFLGRDGFLNYILMQSRIVESPVDFMYTPFAVFLGLLGVLLPFMILTLQSVLEGIDFTVLDAAHNLGAGRVRAFFHVIWPMSLPGVVAGSILVFTLAMNSYATPLLLGGPKFQMMALTVYNQFATTLNWPFGAALAFVLVIVTIIVTIISTFILTIQHRKTLNG